MINNILIENFRSHKNSFLEFDSGVNILIGENDSGKTNILRAINFVLNNRPSGNDFRSAWGGNTEVKVNIEDKFISRIKTDKENLYKITHTNGKEDIFKAFGKGVPEPIQQFLNMSATNIHFQLDGPFLLGLSDADVAKHYNNAINLNIIDSTIANIASILRKEKASLKSEKEREEKLKEKLQRFDWLATAESELAVLEEDSKYLIKLKKDWSDLYSLIKRLKKLIELNNKLKKIIRYEKTVNSLLKQNKNIIQSDLDYADLQNLIAKFKILTKTKQELEEIIQHEDRVNILLKEVKSIEASKQDVILLRKGINKLSFLKAIEKRCQMIVGYEKAIVQLTKLDIEINEQIDRYNELQDLIEKVNKLKVQKANTQKKLVKLEKKFTDQMPDMCPIFNAECNYIKENKK